MTSDTSYQELGEHLLALRIALGWSLRRAAKEIGGISHSRLQDFERGQDPHSAIPTRPSVDQLKRMAKAYKADQEKLLGLAGYSTVEPLSKQEELLIKTFRALSEDKRTELFFLINKVLSIDT